MKGIQKMKKLLIALLMGSIGYLAASADAVWVHDLEAGTSRRTVGDVVKDFNIKRERSADPAEVLPEGAVVDTWYPIVRNVTLDLSAEDGEEIKGLQYAQPVCELQFTYVEGERSTHAHYGNPFNVKSGFPPRTVTRYKCYACEGIQVLMRILRRASGSDVVTTVEDSPSVIRHVRGADIGHDFTNPWEQDYGAGKITPFPEGIGSVNKQTFENTFKRWFK